VTPPPPATNGISAAPSDVGVAEASDDDLDTLIAAHIAK
jgi:hypothetical protein